MQNVVRKTKPTKTMSALPGSLSNILNAIPGNSTMAQSPYIPPELSGISVSPVNSQPSLKNPSTKYSHYKKSSKTKPASMDISSSLPASYSQGNSVEAFSMLSQLKQHSHLEIIPQQKSQQMKSAMEYTKNLSSGMSVLPQKVSESLRSSDSKNIYDLPRGKSGSVSNKKGEKSTNDSVEIITLDD